MLSDHDIEEAADRELTKKQIEDIFLTVAWCVQHPEVVVDLVERANDVFLGAILAAKGDDDAD